MIRIIRTKTLRALHQTADRAEQARTEADEAAVSRVFEADLRAEQARHAADRLTSDLADACAARLVAEDAAEVARGRLEQAAAEITMLWTAMGQADLVILLHYGRVHSVHPTVAAAAARAEAEGAPRSGWTPRQSCPCPSGDVTVVGRPDSGVLWEVVHYDTPAGAGEMA